MSTPTIEEYLRNFWVDPETSLKKLMVEVTAHYVNRRHLCIEVERRSKKRYPQASLPLSSISFWISWAFGDTARSAQRTPSLSNGVKLMTLCLEIKSEKDNR